MSLTTPLTSLPGNIFASAGVDTGSAVTADSTWDLESFFNNSTTYMQTIGGSFLALIGIAGLVWGGFLVIRKLIGGQAAQQDSWFKMIALIIVGGAMLFSGISLLLNFAAGANDTIESFGNGMVSPEAIQGALAYYTQPLAR